MENHAINKKIISKKDVRIAIIGAGAAGLSAADRLKEKGYTHVTLFERSDRAGGKCCTVDIEGRLYELGAGILEKNNKVPLRLAKKYGVETKQAEFGRSTVVDVETGKTINNRRFSCVFRLITEGFRYRALCKKYSSITSPGFENVDRELCMSFAEWANKYNLNTLAREMALYFTGFGYDYFSRISAAYILKYYPWNTIKAFVTRRMYTFPDGIQHLWTAVAVAHDVRYESAIIGIVRDDEGVHITQSQKYSEEEVLSYDKLIITSPLDEAVTFLDATKKEKKLFSQITAVDYRTLVCRIANFPKKTGFCPGNYSLERAGHPVFWYHPHLDSNIYTFYVLGDWQMSDEVVIAHTKELIECMGGTLSSVERVVRWKYFPHVSPKVMKDGFFDEIESLQGKNNTYFAGELLNFSTVGLTSEYADNLIETYF